MLRGAKKLWAEKLRADFSFPIESRQGSNPAWLFWQDVRQYILDWEGLAKRCETILGISHPVFGRTSFFTVQALNTGRQALGSHCFSASKKRTKINFWVRRPPDGVGVFHAKGWWSESSCPPSKVCLPWVWKGGTWGIPGILLGRPGPLQVFEKFAPQKSSCAFFVPYHCFSATSVDESVLQCRRTLFIDLLMGLLRGAVFHRGGCARKP